MDEYEETNNSKRYLILAVAIIAIVATVAAGGFFLKSQDKPAQQANQEVMSASVQENASSQNQYKNGTYEATGNYISPGGAEQIKVTVVLKDNIITSAQVQPQATRPNSVKFQGLFKSGFEPLVVGKNIDTVVLDKVSGSSLAPKGFNDALTQIKEKAKS